MCSGSIKRWDNGKRGKNHLSPSSEYEFSIDPIVGATLVGVCIIGLIVVTVDDLTGVGVADDALLVLFNAGISKGLIMLFPQLKRWDIYVE